MNNIVPASDRFPPPRTAIQRRTDELVATMANHWEANLGNVPSAELRASWRQAFVTFRRKIDEYETDYSGDWHVLSPKTGTGKSESLKVYAAEVSKNNYTAPGILIVVRLIEQADEFVRDINARAGNDNVAIAKHSNSGSLEPVQLAEYPVLVITHAAFTGRPRRNRELWEQYMAYDGVRRKLVAIDEAIDILDVSRLDEDLVSKLHGSIPSFARQKWPKGYRAVGAMRRILDTIRQLPETQTTESRVVMTESRRDYLKLFEEGWEGLDEIEAIREYMRGDEHRYLIGKRNVDSDAEARQKRIYDKLFADLIAVYDSFILHWKSGSQYTLNTATRLLPDDGQGCVVLDATADTNPIYECMERDTYNVIKHPAISCRSYANATLRASFGHAVGRSSLTRVRKGQKDVGAKTEAPKLFAALSDEHARRASTQCPMEQALIVCHKDAKPYLAGFETPFEYALAHYGALDGRNDWRDYDSVVIFGLDYRHPADAPVQFMTLQPESQTDEWLKDGSKRAFKGHSDIRVAIDQGVSASSVIQAVNRIRTRRVIDSAGNCPDSFVYMLLPGDKTGKAIYQTLQEQMPGIQLDPWHFKGAKRAARSKHERAFEEFLKGLEAGESWSATAVREHLGIPGTPWKRLVPKLKSETTAIGQLMVELGVRYEITRTGKTQTARIVKS